MKKPLSPFSQMVFDRKVNTKKRIKEKIFSQSNIFSGKNCSFYNYSLSLCSILRNFNTFEI